MMVSRQLWRGSAQSLVQRRFARTTPRAVPPLERALPRYFEVMQDHMQTFSRFQSDPPWVMDALAEAAQGTQKYYVEDAVRHAFEDSTMNVINYFAETHNCHLLQSRRFVSNNGIFTQTIMTLECLDAKVPAAAVQARPAIEEKKEAAAAVPHAEGAEAKVRVDRKLKKKVKGSLAAAAST
ncbi:hypothetical protein DIPPA_18629 [Diplonema papillatum]|nr:hypothetical protein DIPPA_18629 [Diplonema papillatum]